MLPPVILVLHSTLESHSGGHMNFLVRNSYGIFPRSHGFMGLSLAPLGVPLQGPPIGPPPQGAPCALASVWEVGEARCAGHGPPPRAGWASRLGFGWLGLRLFGWLTA